eukprot:460315-Rhodomonas_salina.1
MPYARSVPHKMPVPMPYARSVPHKIAAICYASTAQDGCNTLCCYRIPVHTQSRALSLSL